MSENLEDVVFGKIEGFAAAMRKEGIHVGMGNNPPVCVTCGEIWPCEASKQTDSPVAIPSPDYEAPSMETTSVFLVSALRSLVDDFGFAGVEQTIRLMAAQVATTKSPIRGYRCQYHDPYLNLGVFHDPHGCRGHGPTWDCTIVALVDSPQKFTYVRGTGWVGE